MCKKEDNSKTEVIHIDFKNKKKIGTVVYNNETDSLVSVSGDETLIEETVDVEMKRIRSL